MLLETVGEGRTARAMWTSGLDEDDLREHFPCAPILPGAPQVQAMGELARLLVATGGGHPPALAGMNDVKFRRFVRPEDRMVLEVETLARTPGHAIVKALALIEGRRVASVGEIHYGFDRAES